MELSAAPPVHDGILYVKFSLIGQQEVLITMFCSGYGNEADNERVEKDFEAAVAKGYRPCTFLHPITTHYIPLTSSKGPTCKKMNDFRSSHTFKAAAFQPTEEEFAAATRRNRPSAPRHSSSSYASSSTSRKPTPQNTKVYSMLSDLEDDDDDLPDLSTALKERKSETSEKKVAKKAVIDDDDSDTVCHL